MKLLAQLITSTLAVMIASFLFKGVHVDSVVTAFLVAAVMAVLNAIVKPILVVLTIPITIVTLGLFLLVINAGLILLDGFWTAFFFSIILALINSIFNALNREQSQD